MRTLFITFLILVGAASPGNAALADEAETYSGTVILPSKISLELAFTIVRDGSGKPTELTMDIPLQGVSGMKAASVSQTGDQISFSFPNIGATVTATISDGGNRLEGTFQQGPASMPLKMTRGALDQSVKTDKTIVPGTATDLSLNTEYGVTINGTLFKPEGQGPFPLVVLITGSGPQDRREMVIPGFELFTQISAHLTAKGIAVFAYDDRAFDQGAETFGHVTSLEHARDAGTALKILKRRGDIDANRTAYLGHSEGGMSEAIAHARFEAASHLVNLAGTTVDLGQVIVHQRDLQNKARGVPDAANQAQLASFRTFINVTKPYTDHAERRTKLAETLTSMGVPQATQPQILGFFATDWMHWAINYDPLTDWSKVTVPVLAIYGEKDLQVDPAQNIPPLRKALKNNQNVTIVTLDSLNHLMQKAQTGLGEEYPTLAPKIDPSALIAISDWLVKQWNL